MKNYLVAILLLSSFAGNSQQIPNSADYNIPWGQLSEQTLKNYLKRNIAMTYLTDYEPTHAGAYPYGNTQDYNCAIQMIRDIQPKMIGMGGVPWAGDMYDHTIYSSAHWSTNRDFLAQCSTVVNTVHQTIDNQVLFIVGISEVVTEHLEDDGFVRIPIPQWVKNEFPAIAQYSHFSATQMGSLNQGVYDITQPMTQAWIYFWCIQFIDIGVEGFFMGMTTDWTANDPLYLNTQNVLSKIRNYAGQHAHRGFVLFTGHKDAYWNNTNIFVFDLHSSPIYILGTTQNTPHSGTSSPSVDGYLAYGDGLTPGMGNDLESTVEDCDPSSLYGKATAGFNQLGWPTTANPYFVGFDNAQSYPNAPDNVNQLCHFPWSYDESSWFAVQSDLYRNHWLTYAWHRVKCMDDQNAGYLQMPGILITDVKVPGHQYSGGNQYKAWDPACGNLNGEGQAETIRWIWDANDHTLPGSYSGKDMRPYKNWAAKFHQTFSQTHDPANGLTEIPGDRKFYGDFNGDGLIDILTTADVYQGQSWQGWRMFLMNSNAPNGGVPYNSTPNFGLSWPSWGEKFYIGDFDGDGKDDFLVTADGSNPYMSNSMWQGWKIYTAATNFSLYASDVFPNSGEKIYIGDFDSDGKDDILTTADKSQGISWAGYKIYKIDPSNTPPLTQIYSATWPSWGENFHIGDFDGNGYDDFMVTGNVDVNPTAVLDGYEVYKTELDPNTGGIAIYKNAQGVWPSWGEKIIVGDWNQDGKSDFTAVASGDHTITWKGSKTYLANETGNHFIYAFDDLKLGLDYGTDPNVYAHTTHSSFKRFNMVKSITMNGFSQLTIFNPLHCSTTKWSSAKPGKTNTDSSTAIISNNNPSIGNASDNMLLTIHPNPSHNGVFNIRGYLASSDKSGRLIVTDIHGRKVLDQEYNGSSLIDLSSNTNGIYILTIKTDSNTITEKIILNK